MKLTLTDNLGVVLDTFEIDDDQIRYLAHTDSEKASPFLAISRLISNTLPLVDADPETYHVEVRRLPDGALNNPGEDRWCVIDQYDFIADHYGTEEEALTAAAGFAV